VPEKQTATKDIKIAIVIMGRMLLAIFESPFYSFGLSKPDSYIVSLLTTDRPA
jgi:hypothetical protein